MKTAFNLVRGGTLAGTMLIGVGIAFGPATVGLLGANAAAAGNGIGAIAEGAQHAAGWVSELG